MNESDISKKGYYEKKFNNIEKEIIEIKNLIKNSNDSKILSLQKRNLATRKQNVSETKSAGKDTSYYYSSFKY